MLKDKMFWECVQDLKTDLRDDALDNKDLVNKLHTEAYFLQEPLVQETFELWQLSGWSAGHPGVRAQAARMSASRQDTKFSLEDKFCLLEDLKRDNRNKQFCRYKGYRTISQVSGNDKSANIKQGQYCDIWLTPSDLEQCSQWNTQQMSTAMFEVDDHRVPPEIEHHSVSKQKFEWRPAGPQAVHRQVAATKAIEMRAWREPNFHLTVSNYLLNRNMVVHVASADAYYYVFGNKYWLAFAWKMELRIFAGKWYFAPVPHDGWSVLRNTGYCECSPFTAVPTREDITFGKSVG